MFINRFAKYLILATLNKIAYSTTNLLVKLFELLDYIILIYVSFISKEVYSQKTPIDIYNIK